MATLKQVTHNVRDSLSGGHPPTDTPISVRQIAFAVRYYRELLIRRDTDYWKRTSEFEQDVGLVSMSVVHEDIGSYGGRPTFLLRSDTTLPARLHLRRRRPLTSVTSPDLRESYDVIQPSAAKYQRYNKYTDSTPRCYVSDDYLYMTSDKVADLIEGLQSGDTDFSDTSSDDIMGGITNVRIRGIFSHPTRAHQFKHERPYNPEEEYPATPNDLVQRITQSILNGEGSIIQRARYDTDLDHLPINSEKNAAQATSE